MNFFILYLVIHNGSSWSQADAVPLFWKSLYDSASQPTKNEQVWKALTGSEISPDKFPAPAPAPAGPLLIRSPDPVIPP